MALLIFLLEQTHVILIYRDGSLVTCACGLWNCCYAGPVWTQTAEHTTLADLLEVVSSIRKYLGRVATVVMAVAERNGAP